MNKKLSFSDKLLQFVLLELEKAPARLFSRHELECCDASAFPRLTDAGLLKRAPYSDPEGRMGFNSEGVPCRVRKIGTEWNLVPTTGDLDEMEPVSTSVLELWRFNLPGFVQIIKQANSLSLPVSEITDRLHYIGEFKTGDANIAVCLGLFSSDTHIERHAGLKMELACDKALLLTPSYEIQVPKLRADFERNGIFCRTFAMAMRTNDLAIDFSDLRAPAPMPETKFVVPPLTTAEQKYRKTYHRRDTIKFTDKKDGARAYIIEVNGGETSLNYPELLVLIRLASQSKQGTLEGWVPVKEMAEAGIVNSEDKKAVGRAVSVILAAMKPYLEKSSVPIIENQRRAGKYRLSTVPTRIKTPDTRWLGNMSAKILKEVVAERSKRIQRISNARAKSRP